MTIKQVIQGLGDWSIRLRQDTPRHVLDRLDYLGHVAVLPGRLDASQIGDRLLTAARYVGVYRGRSADDEHTLSGAGMSFWLGDEDDKGDIFEAGVTLTAQTFANSVTALLPASGAIVAGTIHAQPGTYTGTHRWETPRKALNYLVELFDAEYRVNGAGTLDAGTVAQLYRTTPVVLLVRQGLGGRELARVALPGRMGLDADVEDYATRVVVLAEGEGDAIATGDADAVSVPYKDIHGNTAVITRLVSSAETTAANAPALAQLQLNRFTNPRQAVRLSASAFDVTGDLELGDYLAVYDPDNGFYDLNNEQYWSGRPINPIYLRCIEVSWPVQPGWTVAFRRTDGSWLDLSDWYIAENGDTTIVVGEFSRSLAAVGTQPVGTRPNGDSSVPAAPAFTGFSVGTYQSGTDATTTRAAIRAQWSTPLNIDGSTVLDGDRYELRYRVNQVIGYQVTHDQLELFTHDDFGTHDAMLSEPVEASPQWQSALAGWDSNEFTIVELTPGVQYELQIRAVDSATPPNFGPYSASSFVTTLGDLIAPSIPAAPVVAGSRIAIQVVHELGKATGGTFNLEPDLDHIDVHVGGSASFTPSPDNRVGKLIATGGMVLGEQPAVGSFAVEPVDEIHVKVVAVDRAGNRSGASEAATVTVELIDDAHISDLTVSKVTAGTITATWLNAGAIVTALTGRRISLSGSELAVYGDGGGRLIQLTGQDRRLSFWEPVDDAEGTMYSNPVLELGRHSDGGMGMRVADLFGETKIIVGQIDASGGTGTENYDLVSRDPVTEELVSLSTLAHGIRSSFDFGPWIPTAGSPLVDTLLETEPTRIGSAGRALIMVTATFSLDTASGESAQIEIVGLRDGSVFPSFEWNSRTPLAFTNAVTATSVGGAITATIGATELAEALTPGLWVFRAYASWLGGTSPSVANVNITVLPY